MVIRKKRLSKKKEILDATKTLLLKYGTNSFSTVDVGREVKVTQPLIHFHFGSKEELLKQAFQDLQRNDPHGAEWVRERERRDERSLIRGLL